MALNPAAGEKYRLRDDFGTGPGALLSGAEVKVAEICEPGTPGIGTSTESSVVAELVDVEGVRRFLAFSLSQFKQMFKKVS